MNVQERYVEWRKSIPWYHRVAWKIGDLRWRLKHFEKPCNVVWQIVVVLLLGAAFTFWMATKLVDLIPLPR